MTDSPVITRAQVAALLGIAPSTLLARIGELRTRHNFPAALPGSGGRRYSRALVLAWIDARPAVPHTLPPGQDTIDHEAILLARARATMAAG